MSLKENDKENKKKKRKDEGHKQIKTLDKKKRKLKAIIEIVGKKIKLKTKVKA